jgi:hypothetical protein
MAPGFSIIPKSITSNFFWGSAVTKNPFRYGEAVGGDYFTDRYRERELLLSELSAGHSVLLTAPRHYGKSSLARKIMSELEHQGVITVYIDFERGYSLSRFVEMYLAELLRAAVRQAKELRYFIETLSPDWKDILAKVEQSGELTLDLSRAGNVRAMARDVLDLSQRTAEYKKRPCVVCFDDVTSGGNMPPELGARIRELARAQTGIGYLLVSLDPGADKEQEDFVHLSLGKIEDRYLKAFIKTRFENTGYRIEESVIMEILGMSGGHPHYTQMICRELWNLGHSGKAVSGKNLTYALESLQETHAGHYSAVWQDLSPHQKNLLLAIGVGGGRKIFSRDYVARHHLGSFSTVQKSLGRLLAMKLLERHKQGYEVADIFFQQWLTRRML